MFYSAPRTTTAFGGVDYNPFYQLSAAGDKNKKVAAPETDPECSLGVCSTDADCGSDPEVQCGYTRQSRPPSDCGKEGQPPCSGYKCCMREFTDYEGWDVPDFSEAPNLCPFDTTLNCPEGCQVCDTPGGAVGDYTARCCVEDQTCPYTSQCEIPCTMSSQFQGEGVGCMFCPTKGGLVPCTKDTKPCTFDNFCTANTRKKYRPDKEVNANAVALAMPGKSKKAKKSKQQQVQLTVQEQHMAYYAAQADAQARAAARAAQARFFQHKLHEGFWCR